MPDGLNQIFNVKDKTLLITGASGYFGRYIAETFLDVGAKVILLGRSRKLLKQVEGYRKKFGKNMAVGFCLDFYKRKNLENVLKKVTGEFNINVLINNAYDLSERTGFNTPAGYLENATYDQWKTAFECGLYWAALATQIIGEQFRKAKNGSIINISSMYGVVSPNPKLYKGTTFFNPPTYGVNKAGIIALTRYTATFWGQYGIRCNALLPGPFPNRESKSSNSVNGKDFFLERLKNNTVLNRVGHPDDLRGVLIYLASDASNFMTGQALIVDGGWTVT